MAEDLVLESSDSDGFSLPSSVLNKIKFVDSNGVPCENPCTALPEVETGNTPSNEDHFHEDSDSSDSIQEQISAPIPAIVNPKYKEVHASERLVRSVLKKLSSLIETSPSISSVQRATSKYIDKECNRLLSEMPVSEINRNRRGIRVSALEYAGYSNVKQLSGLSAQKLMQIDGIGQVNASRIVTEMQRLETATRDAVTLNSCNRNTEHGIELVKHYYIYLHQLLYQKECKQQYEQNMFHIADLHSSIRIASNIFFWLFTFSSAKKSVAYQAHYEASEYLHEHFVRQIDDAIIKKKSIALTDINAMWNDYTRHRKSYEKLFSDVRI